MAEMETAILAGDISAQDPAVLLKQLNDPRSRSEHDDPDNKSQTMA